MTTPKFPRDANGAPIQVLTIGTVQKAAYTGTAGTISNVTTEGVNVIMVVCTSDAHINLSVAGTAATTNNMYIPADTVVHLKVNGEKVSAIQDTAAGTLYVAEMV